MKPTPPLWPVIVYYPGRKVYDRELRTTGTVVRANNYNSAYNIVVQLQRPPCKVVYRAEEAQRQLLVDVTLLIEEDPW